MSAADRFSRVSPRRVPAAREGILGALGLRTNREAWLRYQRASYGTWRSLGVAVAVFNVLLTPFNLAFDRQLLLLGDVPVIQVRWLQAIHTYAFATALAYLGFAWVRWHRPAPGRVDFVVLSAGAASVVFVPAAIAAVNQLSHGSVAIFAIGALFMMVVSYERPSVSIGLTLLASATVVVAARTLQQDATLVPAVELNSMLVLLSVTVLYPLYDATRFRAFERSRRLETLNRFKDTVLHALGHDLRTPLVEVRRVARTLEDDLQDVVAVRHELASELDALAYRFGLVLDNLLAIDAESGRHVDLARGPSSLSDVFDAVEEIVGYEAERKGVRVKRADGDDVLLRADGNALVAILNNLVSNAVKFTPPGGTVRLETSIGIDRVEIRVRDTGVGVKPRALERLRAGEGLPPGTGTAGERGVGIGLGVVRRLLAGFGSELHLEAAAEGGLVASFVVERFRL